MRCLKRKTKNECLCLLVCFCVCARLCAETTLKKKKKRIDTPTPIRADLHIRMLGYSYKVAPAMVAHTVS